jgi:hypothetical protein
MNKTRFVLGKDHTKILKIIKRNIDNESIVKRQSLEKLLRKLSVKIQTSKIH